MFVQGFRRKKRFSLKSRALVLAVYVRSVRLDTILQATIDKGCDCLTILRRVRRRDTSFRAGIGRTRAPSSNETLMDRLSEQHRIRPDFTSAMAPNVRWGEFRVFNLNYASTLRLTFNCVHSPVKVLKSTFSNQTSLRIIPGPAHPPIMTKLLSSSLTRDCPQRGGGQMLKLQIYRVEMNTYFETANSCHVLRFKSRINTVLLHEFPVEPPKTNMK